MADSVITQIASVGFNILYNVLTYFIIALLLVVGYFGSKYFGKWRRKKKSYKNLTALVIKRDGGWFTDQLGYFEHPDGVDKLHFKKMLHTIPVIPNEYVRSNQVILFNYGPKQYAVIPPRLWDSVDIKKFNIELVNLQMKNFVFLEQRAAVSRWAYIKDLMARWAPWITLAAMVAAACIIVWFLMKFGTGIFNQVTAQRIAECKAVLPQYVPLNASTGIRPS